ncbi:Mss4-like protein [Phyllosticta capitalensis]|uniref:Mss4-like protein n=1 Tax=Phyllosticta capitalensis TaxID=121624 RepID=A0ABR1YKG2_9PEZI
MKLTGSCFCRAIVYEINLKSPDDATTSLCHCGNCKKAYGTNYGLTTEVPRDAFTYTQGKPKEHAADNGSGIVVTREFCDTCGSLIIEYGEHAKSHWRYVTVGTLDDPDALPPKKENFVKHRASWMPRVSDTVQNTEQ